MATVNARGRGGGPGRGGAGGPGMGGSGGRGGEPGNQRRGSWRGGPPGSMGYSAATRGGSPAGTSPRASPSINDHMTDMKKVQNDKGLPNKIFQTDTEISAAGNSSAPRELQPWTGPDPSSLPNGAMGNGNGNGPMRTNGSVSGAANGARGKDSETFGVGAGDEKGPKWDQFETNRRLFGTKTSYQEEIYTTKLDKSGVDFRSREKEAERLASEIMGQSSGNQHVLEERNMIMEDWTKDDEEKYSGVQRNPNAYVPPAIRRAQGGYAAAAGKAASTNVSPAMSAAKINGVKPPGPPGHTATASFSAAAAKQAPMSGPAPALAASVSGAPQQAGATITKPDTQTPIPPVAKPPSPAPSASTAAPAAPSVPDAQPIPAKAGASPQPPVAPKLADATAAMGTSVDAKEGEPKVVGSFRQYLDSEREKVEAKKKSMALSERERQLADLKKFQASFTVPLPVPKDILPILSKDEEKQKAIEAKIQSGLDAAKASAEAKKLAMAEGSKSPNLNVKSPEPAAATLAPSGTNAAAAETTKAGSKKISMHLPEIPPFNPNKRKPSQGAATAVLPVLPVTDSAKLDIPSAAAMSPSSSATGSQAAAGAAEPAPKLNPKASAFVFKPTAAAFKPGQSSTTSSPAVRPPTLNAPAGPSVQKNPFFGDHVPGRVTVDPRTDFNPFKHGQVPMASAIPPNWPYNGRPVQMSFYPVGQPMGMPGDDELLSVASPQFRPPHLMPGIQCGMPAGYYARYGQPGMQGQQIPAGMQQSPMFSPGPSYAPLPGGMQHMGVPQHAGMPMYFQNGPPQNPQYLPQHMQFNPNMPNSPQRSGPNGIPGGPLGGPGGPGSGMYFPQGQLPTPHHTPQMQHNHPFSPANSSQYQPSPMQPPPIPQPQQQSQSLHPGHAPQGVPPGHHPGMGGQPGQGQGQGQGQGIGMGPGPAGYGGNGSGNGNGGGGGGGGGGGADHMQPVQAGQ